MKERVFYLEVEREYLLPFGDQKERNIV